MAVSGTTFHHKITDIRINAAPLRTPNRNTDGERIYAFHRSCRKCKQITTNLPKHKPKTLSAQSSTSSFTSTSSSVCSAKNIMKRRYKLKTMPTQEGILRMNNRFRLSNTETLRATAHLHTRAWR